MLRLKQSRVNNNPPQGRPPATIPLGGQRSAAYPREVSSPFSAEHPDQRAAQLRGQEAYAAKIEAARPDLSLDPLSIRAIQDALEARCREDEQRQLRLKAEIELSLFRNGPNTDVKP